MTVVAEHETPQAGLYPGLKRSEYEAISAINVSSLVEFERTAAHAREAMRRPRKPTEAMEFGTAFHCAILEPQRFMRDYAVVPKIDRRTKEGKAAWAKWEAEHPGAEPLGADQFNAIQKMRESVYQHPIAAAMMRGKGHNEVGFVCRDEETGLHKKGLVDRIGQHDGWTWSIDAKTTDDAGARAFMRTCKSLHYGARAAYYVDGMNAVEPRQRRFAWIVVEKDAPYAVAVYEADDSAIEAGRSKYMRWLRNYKEAIDSGNWPGYPIEIRPLSAAETEWWNG